jgi:predicted nucleic acid-binding protein
VIVAASKILIDTSVIIDHLRGNISPDVWLKTLEGRAPTISPVTLHEMRRGIVPGSRWENQIEDLMPATSILAPAPDTADWLTAADVIRTCFGKVRSKPDLATLAHDTLICMTAKKLNAEVWSRDKDFRQICDSIGVLLLNH